MSGNVSGWANWRFASRLARREVRRRPGRTALVVVLIALPVAAMTAGSVLARTVSSHDSPWRRGTDLILNRSHGSMPDLPLPSSTTITDLARVNWAPIETADSMTVSGVDLIGGDGGDLVAHPAETTGDDVVPDGDEVWVSTSLAADLHVDVGDTLSLEHPKGSWTVAGVGDHRGAGTDARVLVFGELPIEQFIPDLVSRQTLVDFPSDLDSDARQMAIAEVRGVLDSDPSWNGWIEDPDEGSGDVDGEQLAWGWVAGAIATAAMGIVIAAAFATSARRQITMLGTLDANGAPEAVRARTLSLQGFWSGLAGSIAGIGVAIAGLTAGRSLVARLAPVVADGYLVSVPDLIVIAITGIGVATAAAAVPARSAARIPVLTALAGRRPLGAVPRRLVPIGIAVFAGGVFLLVLAASSGNGGNAVTAAAVLGGLAVLAGAACASPLAIETMSNASASIGGNWRFAGRSLARTRSRSAAVVTAIAVTGAVACAGSALALDFDDSAGSRYLPRDEVVLTPWEQGDDVEHDPAVEPIVDIGPLPARPVDGALRDSIQAIVPDATWHDLRVATWDDPPTPESEAYGDGTTPTLSPSDQIAIADPAVLDLLELGATDRKNLRDSGALVMSGWIFDAASNDSQPSQAVDLRVRSTDGDIAIGAVPRENLHLIHSPDAPTDLVTGPFNVLMTETAARAAGLDIVTRGAIVSADGDLTRAQRNDIYDSLWGDLDFGAYYVAGGGSDRGVGWSASMEDTSWSPPAWMVQGAIITAALLLTLAVVAVALALAATESRDERDVLVAVGARPRTIRSMASAKAVVLSLTGVALAVPTGLVPVATVLRTQDQAFHMPWLSLLGLIVIVPAVAGVAAWMVSTVAQRIRPVTMSTLATD